jgi:hypothetical protein
MIKYIIQCNSFRKAAEVAAFEEMHLSQWEWLPLRTIHDDVSIYELRNND